MRVPGPSVRPLVVNVHCSLCVEGQRSFIHSFIHSFVHSFIHPLHSAFIIEVVVVEEVSSYSFIQRLYGMSQAKTKRIIQHTLHYVTQRGADAEKQRSFMDGHRLHRAMIFELFFA